MRQKTLPATGLLLLALLFGAFGGATALFALSPLRSEGGESKMTEGPVGSAFTYQGRLDDTGGPANGLYDFEFTLYDAPSGGTALGGLTLEDIPVTDGLFTVILDFGSNVFDGNARYLRLGVRPGQDPGPYTILGPRQPLTPAPYAIYATTAPWSGISGIPPDLADGDDDTTYSPGFGLVLNGTQFEVDPGAVQLRVGNSCMPGSAIQAINQDGTIICETDDDTTYNPGFGLVLNGTQFEVDPGTVQLRVGDSCMAGQAIQSINADGSVSCADVTSPSFNSKPEYAITSLDSAGDAGRDNDITIGSDGLALISYIGFNTPSYGLRVAHCDNLACTSAITTTLDSGDTFDSAITIGTDGLGLISYYEGLAGLKVAHCNNLLCTSAITTLVETENAFSTGQVTGIAIGADGLGLISYWDGGNFDLNVAHCDNLACTSVITATLDSSGDVGRYSAITIGADGLGLISYYDSNGGNLKVATCLDQSCTSASTTVVDSTNDVGYDTAITIGSDGRALISYFDTTLNNVKVAHCDNMDCSVSTITNLDFVGNAGGLSSITIGADGLGLISYVDGGTGDLKLAHCDNLDCTLATITTLDYSFDFSYNGITVGADGLTLISYFDDAGDDLWVARSIIGRGIRNR